MLHTLEIPWSKAKTFGPGNSTWFFLDHLQKIQMLFLQYSRKFHVLNQPSLDFFLEIANTCLPFLVLSNCCTFLGTISHFLELFWTRYIMEYTFSETNAITERFGSIFMTFVSSCYRTVPSVIWEYFPSFWYFATYFTSLQTSEITEKYEKRVKHWPILHEATLSFNACSNVARVVLLTFLQFLSSLLSIIDKHVEAKTASVHLTWL